MLNELINDVDLPSRYHSPGCSSYRIAVKLGGDKSWIRISDEFVHGRRGSLIKSLMS